MGISSIDFTRRDGTGGESIYGGPLLDEGGFKRKHDIEGKHVVFGRVVKGYDVVEKIENTPTDERNDRPLSIVMISNCGELELKLPPKLLEQQKLQQTAAASKKKKHHSDDSDSDSEKRRHERHRRRRSQSRSRSPSDSDSDEDSNDQKGRHSKRHKKQSRSGRSRQSRSPSGDHRGNKGSARDPSSSVNSSGRGLSQDGRNKDNDKPDLDERKTDNKKDENYYERQIEATKSKPRERSRSPEIKYKGRGAMLKQLTTPSKRLISVDMNSGRFSEDEFDDSSDFTYGSEDEDYDIEYEQTEDVEYSEPQQKKAYEVEFKSLLLSDILAAQSSAASHVAGILGVTVSQASKLLRSHKWNKEQLIEKYMDTPQEILNQAGVVLGETQASLQIRPKGFVCLICFDDDSAGSALGLRCGHVFCQPCYEQYLTQKIAEEGECRAIFCPESGCAVPVDDQVISSVVGASIMQKYQMLQDRAYVSDLDNLRWCPAPNCENAEIINPHPVDLSSYGRKSALTTPRRLIGSRQTQKSAEASSTDARDQQAKSRASLERYLHYYNRFANHEQSARLDQNLYLKTEKKMEEMQRTTDLSWIEVQFLKNAVDVLTSCRMTLRWTYAFAFYLVKDNMTELFEDNQRDLEVAVEALSELLEKPIEKEKIAELRQQVLDKTVYVGVRREVVLDDTAKGLVDGRWVFHTQIQ
ncbi:hypothetical protein BGZ79_006764 [Entomortierella chlamydospora]|nr:hypothetical protein BGZ79_006764 [Entomortierella chlamydospora]